MKRIFLLTTCLGLLINATAKQFEFYRTYYGINVYQASTGSGYGPSTNINLNAQKFNRVFELGILFDSQHQNIKGAEFMYKHFVGFHTARFYNKTLKPFVFYNFLYRVPTEVIIDESIINSISTDPFEKTPGRMTTFEHSIGFGLQMRLISQFYLEGNAGFGVYFGSHYQGTTPKTWGIHLKNYGFVPSFKLGLGYQF